MSEGPNPPLATSRQLEELRQLPPQLAPKRLDLRHQRTPAPRAHHAPPRLGKLRHSLREPRQVLERLPREPAARGREEQRGPAPLPELPDALGALELPQRELPSSPLLLLLLVLLRAGGLVRGRVEGGHGDGERGVELAHALDADDEALRVGRGERREVVAERGAAELPGGARERVEEREEELRVGVAALAQEPDHARGVHDQLFWIVRVGRRRRRRSVRGKRMGNGVRGRRGSPGRAGGGSGSVGGSGEGIGNERGRVSAAAAAAASTRTTHHRVAARARRRDIHAQVPIKLLL